MHLQLLTGQLYATGFSAYARTDDSAPNVFVARFWTADLLSRQTLSATKRQGPCSDQNKEDTDNFMIQLRAAML